MRSRPSLCLALASLALAAPAFASAVRFDPARLSGRGIVFELTAPSRGAGAALAWGHVATPAPEVGLDAGRTLRASAPQAPLRVANVELSRFAWMLTGAHGVASDEAEPRVGLSLVDAIATIAPEPDTAVLLSAGLLGIAVVGRDRRRRAQDPASRGSMRRK